MCLIIEKEADKEVKPEFWADVAKKNQDGWGLMWLNRRGHPTIRKGLKMSDFYKEYERVKHKHLFVHFRFTTHGATNYDNAHPHEIIPGVYMMHNGSFGKFSTPKDPKDKSKSDTAIFAKEFVRPLLEKHGAEFLRTPEFMSRITAHTSSSNKLVFVDKKGFLVVEPNLWSRTLTGLRVSNSYAYTMDCPPSQYNGYSAQRRGSYYDDEDTYGRKGHNTGGSYCEYGDEQESYFRNVYGPSHNDNSGTTSTVPPKKDNPLELVANNAKSTDEANKLKPLTESVEDYMYMNLYTVEEIEELVLVDSTFTARMIKALMTEIAEYGYSADKLRLSGITA